MEHETRLERPRSNGIVPITLVIALFSATALIIGVWVKDSREIDALNAEHARTMAAVNESLNNANSRIQELNTRINALSQSQTHTRAASEAKLVRPATHGPRAVRRLSATRATANDPRVDKLQGQLADTQAELAKQRQDVARTQDDIGKTREDVARTREELAQSREEFNGRINSTREDLNGSIAKTHDEVIALRKRGEQNVYEFRLNKSKQFQRVGPLSVSLRGSNPKHKNYDLQMMVEDNQLTKKHVNLYEPVWINLADRAQPVELVVNRVSKDQVEGYVTEPKYRKSELASSSEKPLERPAQLVTR